MIGINIENLDKLIKINNINSESLDTNLNKLRDCFNDLDNCYSGNDIHFAFSDLLRQNNNLEKIHDIVNNYSEVLSMVKNAYLAQDEQIMNSVNKDIANL